MACWENWPHGRCRIRLTACNPHVVSTRRIFITAYSDRAVPIARRVKRKCFCLTLPIVVEIEQYAAVI